MIINLVRTSLVMIFLTANAAAASAMMKIDLETELKLIEKGKVEQRIPGADYRVAVFAYEDPDGTGLGTGLAALIANHVLVASQVTSLGVIHYEGSLAPSHESKLSYFNKVDKVIEAQKVSLAIWGMVRSVGSTLVIDTYLQIPQPISIDSLAWKFALPARIGGGTLVAHLRPDRIHVQHLTLPRESSQLLTQAAQRTSELRKERTVASEVIPLPLDQVYWMTDRKDDWAELELPSGKKGWIPITGHCLDSCRPLLDAAAFAGEILGYLSHHKMRTPNTQSGLMEDTQAIGDQILALDLIAAARFSMDIDGLLDDLTRRVESAPQSGTPPGGAAFANVLAIGRLMSEVHRAYEDQFRFTGRKASFDELTVPTQTISNIAFDLAQASLYDPQNLDVLQNLAVLFDITGDPKRAVLAKELALKATADSQ